MKLKFHQKVNTPNGPGIVQGWKVTKDPETGDFINGQVLVSHPKKANEQGKINGVWELAAYPPDQITELEGAKS